MRERENQDLHGEIYSIFGFTTVEFEFDWRSSTRRKKRRVILGFFCDKKENWSYIGISWIWISSSESFGNRRTRSGSVVTGLGGGVLNVDIWIQIIIR